MSLIAIARLRLYQGEHQTAYEILDEIWEPVERVATVYSPARANVPLSVPVALCLQRGMFFQWRSEKA